MHLEVVMLPPGRGNYAAQYHDVAAVVVLGVEQEKIHEQGKGQEKASKKSERKAQ